MRRVNIGSMPDIPPQLSEIAYFAQHLTTIEFVWFLAWNIADGRWTEMGLTDPPVPLSGASMPFSILLM
jgi:hypothetical protein